MSTDHSESSAERFEEKIILAHGNGAAQAIAKGKPRHAFGEFRLDVKTLYSDNVDKYLTSISLIGYPQALRRFFETYDRLRPNLRVLDAGCGAGTATFALLAALDRRGLSYRAIDGFDLTPAMLARFEKELAKRETKNVNFREADVLALQTLPSSWTNYDLIIAAAMLEYVPRTSLSAAIRALRER